MPTKTTSGIGAGSRPLAPVDSAAGRGTLHGFVATLTSMTAEDDAHEVYEAWAPTYEADLVGGYGYTAHRIAAEGMAGACPERAAEILDIGCGTGLVAVELAARGFSTIDGLDASARMLAEARAKGIYRDLRGGDVCDPAAVEPGRYDAAIADRGRGGSSSRAAPAYSTMADPGRGGDGGGPKPRFAPCSAATSCASPVRSGAERAPARFSRCPAMSPAPPIDTPTGPA